MRRLSHIILRMRTRLYQIGQPQANGANGPGSRVETDEMASQNETLICEHLGAVLDIAKIRTTEQLRDLWPDEPKPDRATVDRWRKAIKKGEVPKIALRHRNTLAKMFEVQYRFAQFELPFKRLGRNEKLETLPAMLERLGVPVAVTRQSGVVVAIEVRRDGYLQLQTLATDPHLHRWPYCYSPLISLATRRRLTLDGHEQRAVRHLDPRECKTLWNVLCEVSVSFWEANRGSERRPFLNPKDVIAQLNWIIKANVSNTIRRELFGHDEVSPKHPICTKIDTHHGATFTGEIVAVPPLPTGAERDVHLFSPWAAEFRFDSTIRPGIDRSSLVLITLSSEPDPRKVLVEFYRPAYH